ncbi:MAG: glycosyltransferase family 2 protein [Adhaeribacter sp.]
MVQVSVIIVNFNSSSFTSACIESILSHTEPGFSFEIIVVDNDSRPQDYEQLVQAWQDRQGIHLLRSVVNLGFSGGNMLGTQAAKGEYLYFLNNDCELLNDNLSLLYQFMKARPQAGLCTGQMHYGNLDFHHSFGYAPTLALRLLGPGLLRLFAPRHYPLKQTAYTDPLAVPVITGAALFADREKFASLGGFDTTYFLYCEEEDLCWRMRRKGYEVYLVPAARFKHHMGKSTQRSFAIELENYISLLYYHRKFNSWPAYQALKLVYFFKNLKKVLRHPMYGKLAFYILLGAPMKYSLKHKQQLHFL